MRTRGHGAPQCKLQCSKGRVRKYKYGHRVRRVLFLSSTCAMNVRQPAAPAATANRVLWCVDRTRLTGMPACARQAASGGLNVSGPSY